MALGDIHLGDMKSTYYPPEVKPQCIGLHSPMKAQSGNTDWISSNVNYYQSRKNGKSYTFTMPCCEWGFMNIPFTTKPEIAVEMISDSGKYLRLPRPKFTMLDPGRQQEVDDFYKTAQLHRDQYRDHSGRLHALDYYKKDNFLWQCPTDPTSVYMKYPQYYVKYRDPVVLPITLERSYRSPMLPDRALTGRFNKQSYIR